METKFWDDSWYSVKTLDEAIDWARKLLAEHKGWTHFDVCEVRKPEFSDVPDLFQGTLEYICDMVEYDNNLNWENGGPWVDNETTSEQAITLRSAITEYLRRNTDLGEAAWQNTGMVLRVTRDGHELIESGSIFQGRLKDNY